MKTSIRALIRKGLHRSNVGALLVLVSLPLFFYVGPASASPALFIIDTLGAATPSTQFSVSGAGGTTIASYQLVGPEFVLAQPTVITEIGGFINNCGTIISGVPQCPHTLPVMVQIRPSTNGLPDSTTILAAFALSNDNDPLRFTYESVTTHLTLGSGTYFAIFATQADDVATLLGNASDPFVYQAGLVNLGVLGPAVGGAVVNRGYPAAVRILGLPAPLEVNIDIKPGSASNVINTKSEGKIRVAILSVANFDAPSLVDKNSLTFGKTGYETTLAFCDKGALDVNHDGRPDVVCFFNDHGAGFQSGDGAGILNGRTTSGAAFTGSDSIRIVP